MMKTQYLILRPSETNTYRGVDRPYPEFRDDLPIDAPANRAFMRLVESQRQNLFDAESALSIADELDSEGTRVDVIAVDRLERSAPAFDSTVLGFDVGNVDGFSMLSWQLTWRTEALRSRPQGPLLELIQFGLRPRLNEWGLFSSFDDADLLLRVAESMQSLIPGIWEAPGHFVAEVLRIRAIRSAAR